MASARTTVLLNESRSRLLSSELGENADIGESVAGNSSLSTNIPPSSRNTRYKPFCAARFTSARSRPARVKPMPAKQPVPRIRNSNICGRLIRLGFQPNNRPTTVKITSCAISITQMADILAATSRRVPSGVVPNRLKTP